MALKRLTCIRTRKSIVRNLLLLFTIEYVAVRLNTLISALLPKGFR